MKNKKQAQDALLEAIDIMIDQKIKKLGFNYYVDGVVQSKNNNNTYNVLIHNTLYKNIPSKNNFEYMVNDTVQIVVKNGDWNKKIIDDKIGHNKMPQNIFNLGTRIRIYGNSDFDDYKTIGSYAVYGNVDATTIKNIPCQMAGILDVYSSNGEIITANSSYIYLIQEYTSLNGDKRYYRQINKSGHNAQWNYGKWFEISTTSTVQDYVVEQGEIDIWMYRKWNSGILECWGTTNAVTLSFDGTAGLGCWYGTTTPSFKFPTNANGGSMFIDIPTVTQTCDSGSAIIFSAVTHIDSEKVNLTYGRFYGGNDDKEVNFHLFAKGRWK